MAEETGWVDRRNLALNKRGSRLVIILTVFMFFDFVFIAIRLYSRRIKKRALDLSDYSILIGFALLIGIYALEIVQVVQCGLGLEYAWVSANLGVDNISRLLKNAFAANTLWNLCTMAIKISILHLYLTIFNSVTAMRRICWALVVVVVLGHLGTILESLLICKPLSYIWNFVYPTAKGKCTGGKLASFIPGLISLTLDIIVFVMAYSSEIRLPLPVLWSLRMPTSKKIATSSVFGIALGIVIVSAVRLSFVYTNSTDYTKESIKYSICGAIEPMVAILVSCTPMLQPVVQHLSGGKVALWATKRSAGGSGPAGSGNVSWPHASQKSYISSSKSPGVKGGFERMGEEDGDYPLIDRPGVKRSGMQTPERTYFESERKYRWLSLSPRLATMSTYDDPLLMDSGDGKVLPAYLTRHVNLGLENDDISALISSIELSQVTRNSQPSPLPHLPAEILLRVLEHVPVDYILEFRAVCRGFRDYIDTRVMYSYLLRSELLGWIGCRGERELDPPWEKRYTHYVPARFERLDVDVDGNGKQPGARWNASYAIFRIEKGSLNGPDPWPQNTTFVRLFRTLLDPQTPPLTVVHHYGRLRWCVKVDSHILDCAFIEPWESCESLQVDFKEQTVRVLWKDMIQQLVREEAAIRKKMEVTQSSPYTFGHEEDCLRAIRRRRLRLRLPKEPTVPEHRKIVWALRHLQPLFGKTPCAKLSYPWGEVENVEDGASAILMLLRKEAATGDKELQHLRQLASDRAAMLAQRDHIEKLVENWHINIFDREVFFGTDLAEKEGANPVAWSDRMRALVEQRVRRWKSQEKLIDKMIELMETLTAVMEVPEDAFDNIHSQY
ncbi:uncharacterized protein BDR25DRAFT_317988 [Lindgomyces ingoldianus]|uniref:Uncharacterized protein n=1 Tax=Lindgomyces ingoldianus TaxID=673940 RepID=A0ACB6QGZ6_9PLEO|nr:uncharacterized protein BDR25DRAFT_317988 [Lindgomyces ingoldianus]KAF2466201.1 hypothetical protein BDR25DRAFT_317988 [Lindgomyces ingoldianus]